MSASFHTSALQCVGRRCISDWIKTGQRRYKRWSDIINQEPSQLVSATHPGHILLISWSKTKHLRYKVASTASLFGTSAFQSRNKDSVLVVLVYSVLHGSPDIWLTQNIWVQDQLAILRLTLTVILLWNAAD